MLKLVDSVASKYLDTKNYIKKKFNSGGGNLFCLMSACL